MSPAWQRTHQDRGVCVTTCNTTLPRDTQKTPQLTITGLRRAQPKGTAQVEEALAGGQEAPKKDETPQGQHLLTQHLWRDTHQPKHQLQHRVIGSLGTGPTLSFTCATAGWWDRSYSPQEPSPAREPSPAPQHPLTTQRSNCCWLSGSSWNTVTAPPESLVSPWLVRPPTAELGA